MRGAEQGAELAAEHRLVRQRRRERAKRSPEQLLAAREGRALKDDAPVEEQRAGDLDPERPVEIAGEELRRHRRSQVVGDDEYGTIAAGPRDELLAQVRLPSNA